MLWAHGTVGLCDKALGSPVSPAATPPASGSFCQGHSVATNSCLTSMFPRRRKKTLVFTEIWENPALCEHHAPQWQRPMGLNAKSHWPLFPVVYSLTELFHWLREQQKWAKERIEWKLTINMSLESSSSSKVFTQQPQGGTLSQWAEGVITTCNYQLP